MLTDISESIQIEASRARVWTVLTGEGLVEEWLGCFGFRPVVGTLFYMQPDPAKRESGDVEGATHCELEALEVPERMRFSWFMPGTPKTRVTIELSDSAGGTLVRLRHGGWEQFDEEEVRSIHAMLAGGWKSFVLPGLKRVAEAGDPGR
jgi:uncharacterized protein YndB with AHSA1/START domain